MPTLDKERQKHRQLALVQDNPGETLGKGGYCNMPKGDGKPCRRKAGSGTDHVGYGACINHGGNSPALKKQAARQAARRLTAELDMDPYEALALTVRLAAGAVAWCRDTMERAEEALDEATGADADAARLRFELAAAIYGEERDRLSRHAKVAIDAGIDAKRLELEQAQVVLFAEAMRAILDDLKLSPQQRRLAPEIVRTHMHAIDTKVVKGA